MRGKPDAHFRRDHLKSSVAGYLLGTVYCLASGGSQTELFMYLSYVICGVLIALSSYQEQRARRGCRRTRYDPDTASFSAQCF